MAGTNQSDSPSLNTINNIFGTSLEFPKCFRKPGTSSNFELKSGSGQTGFDGAAATFTLNPTSPISMQMLGLANDVGVRNIVGALTVTGQTLFIGGFKGETAYWSLNTGSWSITSGGKTSITSGEGMKIISNDTLTLVGTAINISSAGPVNVDGIGELVTVVNKKKDFDIPHPTKSGWRLRHVAIEGPTADVYIRGILSDSNVIELPEYWTGLVDSTTIITTLTPIGTYQELFVEKIENNKVFVKNNSSSAIRCNYLICAERKDTEKNIPEYQGNYEDYPGDNDQYLGSIINMLKKNK
jgi:hypothetical protein